MTSFPGKAMAAVLLGALSLAPLRAAAERIVTRSGEVLVGSPRFEGDYLVVRRADGSEVRIRREQVERIEQENGAPVPRSAPAPAPRTAPAPAPAPRVAPPPKSEAAPPARRRQSPGYPTYVPPPPPPEPDPTVGRRMLEHQGFRNGLALKLGYQRGMAAGLEWQQRIDRFVGLGVGGQIGLATNAEVACPTWGGTGRLYVGNEHRFAAEVGVGLNRIDPYLAQRGSREPACSRSEKNVGPEFSAGYQYASRAGFLFEALGGLAVITNEELAAAHDDIAPLFQINFGFVFR